MGALRDPDEGEPRYSRLVQTKYLPSLDGVVWKSHDPGERGLETALQLFFRRHRVDFQILKHPSDPKTKFDLFQRLNRGGAYANEQEVRTCSMVLANAAVTRMMREFCARQDFAAIFRVTEEQRQNQTDLEYAVRLMVHTAADLSRRTDVQEFLDRAILDILTSDEAEEWVNVASWVVAELHRLLGENALIPPDERLAGIAPRFSLRALEGIAVGVGRNRAAIMQLPDRDAFIRDRVANFWLQPEVAEMSAAGLRGTVRLQRSIPFGTRWFNPNA